MLGGVVGSDPRGEQRADPAGTGDKHAHRLGENGVGVDFPASSERKPAGISKECASRFTLMACGQELSVESRIILLESVNPPFPLRTRRRSDRRVTGSEEFLLRQLRLLPRRI